MRVLIVEDNAVLGDALSVSLKQAGYVIDWVTDGIQALHALASTPYGAIILDIGLPKLSGLEVLTQLRHQQAHLPVLMLTARDTIEDRIAGLDRGADDYLVKPFDMGELTARLRALIRRANGHVSPVLAVDEVQLDPAAHTVYYQGNVIDVSSREFTVLHTLMLHCGRVLSRAQLEDALYAWNEEVESNTVEVHIHHLRRKLYSGLIETVRGVGYWIPKPKAT